jgi:hypothetical protein
MPEKEAAAIIIPFELRTPGVRNDRVSGPSFRFRTIADSFRRAYDLINAKDPPRRGRNGLHRPGPAAPLEAMAAAVRTMLRREGDIAPLGPTTATPVGMPRVGYLDVFNLSIDRDGRAWVDLFFTDRLHVNAE